MFLIISAAVANQRSIIYSGLFQNFMLDNEIIIYYYFIVMARCHHRHRARIITRDLGQCRLCSGTDDLDVHHIIPQNKGGKAVDENLVTLCTSCHPMIKNSEIDWAKIIAMPPGYVPCG